MKRRRAINKDGDSRFITLTFDIENNALLCALSQTSQENGKKGRLLFDDSENPVLLGSRHDQNDTCSLIEYTEEHESEYGSNIYPSTQQIIALTSVFVVLSGTLYLSENWTHILLMWIQIDVSLTYSRT